MKIVLATLHRDRSYTPLALQYLQHSIQSQPFSQEIQIEIQEYHIRDAVDKMKARLLNGAPDMIGLSCYVWNTRATLELARSIKEESPETQILLGGPEVSPEAEAVLSKNNCVDFIIRDEGEKTFVELIRAQLDGADLSGIQGLSFRRDSKIVHNLDRAPIAELDTIPSPHFEKGQDLDNRVICFETTRGCPFRCHFCFYDKGYGKVRTFSMERVQKELLEIMKHNPRKIYLMDPLFNMNMKRAKEILRFIAENNPKRILFHAEIKAEFVDEEMAELFQASNCSYLEVGLQATDNEALKLANRHFHENRFENGFHLLKKHQIDTEIHLIVGLPGDTPQSFEKALQYVADLDPKHIGFHRLEMLPGTHYRDNAKKLGLEYLKEPPYSVLSTPTMSLEQINALLDIQDHLELLRKIKGACLLAKELDLPILEMVKQWIAWLADKGHRAEDVWDREDLYLLLMAFVKDKCLEKSLPFEFYDVLFEKERQFVG